MKMQSKVFQQLAILQITPKQMNSMKGGTGIEIATEKIEVVM